MSNTKIKAGQFSGIVGNGTDGYFLMTNGDGTMVWAEGGSAGPSVTSVSYPGDDTAADPAGGQTVVLTGTGFAASGMSVTIGGTTAPSVAHDSNTQLTITTPAKAAGDYDIVVINDTTGASGTFVNGISYNGVPTWTTAAGSLGTFDSNTTISTITLQATEPDGGTITFNITNGVLPTGLSLTGANIDGTTTAESSTTLYSFTIEAIDDENQATPRNFSITVNSDAIVPSENFTPKLYTGGSAGQVITGVGFQPDLIIAKRRDGTENWFVVDVARTGSLFLNINDAEISYRYLTPNSDGFVVNGTGGVHNTGSLVAYCFKGGGAAVSNTNGSITSQVSANTDAGFSIVSYTGNSVQGATVGHGLSSAPELIIAKSISTSIASWRVGATPIGWQYYMNLDGDSQAYIASSIWNSTAPTSSVFSLGNNADANGNGETKIAYCFHSVDGYQKVGSYTSNASVKITTGFEPRWIMIKYTGVASNWWIMDILRYDGSTGLHGGKLVKPYLEANTSDTEASVTNGSVEFVSDGFYPTNFFNSNGVIYLAIA